MVGVPGKNCPKSGVKPCKKTAGKKRPEKNPPFFTPNRDFIKKSILFYARPGFEQKNTFFLRQTGILTKKSFFFAPDRDLSKKIIAFLRQTRILSKKITLFSGPCCQGRAGPKKNVPCRAGKTWPEKIWPFLRQTGILSKKILFHARPGS